VKFFEQERFMTYPISALDGIDAGTVARLKAAGIRTTERLLEAAKDAKGRKALEEQIGVDAKRLLCWANMADRMRIKGMGRDYAELLRQAGVDTVRELKHRNAARLARAIAAANQKRRRVRLPPSEKAVTRWIDQAKKLPLKISY
jgi:predicted RecB family nuclease